MGDQGFNIRNVFWNLLVSPPILIVLSRRQIFFKNPASKGLRIITFRFRRLLEAVFQLSIKFNREHCASFDNTTPVTSC